jgi:hypothetical protein
MSCSLNRDNLGLMVRAGLDGTGGFRPLSHMILYIRRLLIAVLSNLTFTFCFHTMQQYVVNRSLRFTTEQRAEE